MALFITFEGGEGSGKTTQAMLLHKRLLKLSIPALLLQEPGGTPIGIKLARLLKWSEGTGISPLTELLLFNASRAELVEQVIQPNLKEGKVVICDRYADSSTAYQGYGRGLNLEIVRNINNTATRELKPGLTVLLDITVEEGLKRKRGKRRDRFEQEEMAFHRRIRDGYLKLVDEEPERWLVVDASQSKEKIKEIIWQRVRQLLSR